MKQKDEDKETKSVRMSAMEETDIRERFDQSFFFFYQNFSLKPNSLIIHNIEACF